jgi:organic radical activating enzyme
MCCYANVVAGKGVLNDEQGNALNMSTTAVDDIRNHPLVKEVRKSFLEGQWHASCQRCRVEEENQQRSGRIHSLTRIEEFEEETHQEGALAQKVFSLTHPDGSINPSDFPVEELDLRFGNKCNLSCRSCGPVDSSGWYSDYAKMGNESFDDTGGTVYLRPKPDGRIEAINDHYNWYEGIDVPERFSKDLSKLRRVYFVGGEPLLMKEHLRTLEWLVAQGLSKKISLEYNTNLTVLPDAVMTLWKEFDFVGVGVSMDGFGKFHEYLRYPGKAEIMEKNLRKLDQSEAHLRGWLACTISAQNISHLPDFIIWKEQQQFKKIRNDYARPPISVHLLHKPAQMNVRSLPAEAKKLVERRLLDGLKRIRSETQLSEEKLESTETLIMGLISYMNRVDDSDKWPYYWEWNLKLDKIRNQTFFDIDPELATLMQNAALAAQTASNTVGSGN